MLVSFNMIIIEQLRKWCYVKKFWYVLKTNVNNEKLNSYYQKGNKNDLHIICHVPCVAHTVQPIKVIEIQKIFPPTILTSLQNGINEIL